LLESGFQKNMESALLLRNGSIVISMDVQQGMVQTAFILQLIATASHLYKSSQNYLRTWHDNTDPETFIVERSIKQKLHMRM